MQIGFIGGGDSYRKIKKVFEPLRWEGKCGIHRSYPKESSCVKVFWVITAFSIVTFIRGWILIIFFLLMWILFIYLFIFVICFPLHFITKIRVGFYCLSCFFYSDFYKRLDSWNGFSIEEVFIYLFIYFYNFFSTSLHHQNPCEFLLFILLVVAFKMIFRRLK